MSAPDPYDLEQVYDDEISPLMAQIIEICKRENMPMVASFQYARDEDHVDDCCTSLINGLDGRYSRSFDHAHALIQRGLSEGESVKVVGGAHFAAMTIKKP